MNSTLPYTKNGQILKSSTGKTRLIGGANYSNQNKPFHTVSFNYNGTLNGWPSTAITEPSKLPLFTQNRGDMNIQGFATSNPWMNCPNAGEPCIFKPSTPTCFPFQAGGNGAWSEMFINSGYTQWVHGRGQVTVQSDTSTKWRSMNSGVNTPSDFRTMYWTRFRADGASITEWQDTNFCHTMLFQPDFDFATYGSPIEY